MTTPASLLPTLSVLNDEVDKLLSHKVVQETWNDTVVSIMARLTPSKTPQQTQVQLVTLLQTPSVLIPQQGTEDFPEVFMCEGVLYVKEDVFSDMSDIVLKDNTQSKDWQPDIDASSYLRNKVDSLYNQQNNCPKLSQDDFKKRVQEIKDPKTKAFLNSVSPCVSNMLKFSPHL